MRSGTQQGTGHVCGWWREVSLSDLCEGNRGPSWERGPACTLLGAHTEAAPLTVTLAPALAGGAGRGPGAHLSL